MKIKWIGYLLKVVLVFVLCFILYVFMMNSHQSRRSPFNSQNAFIILSRLQSFGPRVPGSYAHAKARDVITTLLKSNGWATEIQSGFTMGQKYHNILARRGNEPIELLLGSHYDSRLMADHDLNPVFHTLPVPGANDGGSSTVVLLELSRILPLEASKNIALVFFDLEDQGILEGWNWILGSQEFVKSNPIHPDVMILLDMIGGHDQAIQPPINSNQKVYREIQVIARELEYADFFKESGRFSIIDDHVPFLDAGIQSVDLIDIVDPYWHTTSDDLENVSLTSLQRIGDTLTRWILTRSGKNGY